MAAGKLDVGALALASGDEIAETEDLGEGIDDDRMLEKDEPGTVEGSIVD